MDVMVDWLKQEDSQFLKILRAISIFVIVFGHVGGFWIYRPWSEFLHVFVSIFFFISGAVSYNGYIKRKNIAQYVYKRIVGLLVPYYCICIFAFFIFLLQHSSFPDLYIYNLIKWITITPSHAIMPFPLGQVWFLRVLGIIALLSPIIFYIYNINKIIFALILCISLFVSSIPVVFNVIPDFPIVGYTPIVYMLFFYLGPCVFDNENFRSSCFSLAIIIASIFVSVMLIKLIGVDIDYANHIIYVVDIYFVTGSIGAIYFCLLCQEKILSLYKTMPGYLRNIVDFFYKHTFSIFLLHTFSIYFVEKLFELISYGKEKTISYGIFKLIFVLLLTVVMSPAFTKITSIISNKLNIYYARNYFKGYQ